MKLRSLIAFALILAGLVIGAVSFFDRGIETIDPTTGHSPLTTKVCSDYPQNAQPADCLTSAQVLNQDGRINHPLLRVLAALLVVGGVVLLIHQPAPGNGDSATRREWQCSTDGTWNPVSVGSCQRCGNGRLGTDRVRGNLPGDVWPNAPVQS